MDIIDSRCFSSSFFRSFREQEAVAAGGGVVGVGGAGSNAVDRLKMENLERLQLAVINTDYQALASSPVQDKVLM